MIPHPKTKIKIIVKLRRKIDLQNPFSTNFPAIHMRKYKNKSMHKIYINIKLHRSEKWAEST